MAAISQEVETKLLYETLASQIIEETLAATKLQIGGWKLADTIMGEDDQIHRLYGNTGIPVTFELTSRRDGSLELTRARPTFLWEKHFGPFEDWLGSGAMTADWMDGLMFRHTLPKDFKFGMVSQFRSRPLGTPAEDFSNFVRVHFQPLRASYREDAIDSTLEVEHAIANIGQTFWGHDQGTNYYDFEGTWDGVMEMLSGMGFIREPCWVRPKSHPKWYVGGEGS